MDWSKREWLGPTLLAACVFAAVLAARPTLDGHEVLVAQTAREMIAGGDYVHPTFAGEPRLQKPPLAYWTCVLSFRLFGEHETAARLPSALASVVGVALTAFFARRAFGPGMGFLAGSVQATSLWTISYGRQALVDAMLTTLVSAAVLVAAWDRLGRRAGSAHHGESRLGDGGPSPPYRPWLLTPAFWALCGLIVLAKGPVGLAMLLPPVIGYRLLRGRRETDAPLVLHPAALLGGLLFLSLALPWPMAILARHPEAWELWTGQSVGRFQEHWGPQTRPWWYFFVQAPWLLFPWSLPLIAVMVRRPRFDVRDPHRLLVVLWFGTAFLLCTLSAGKRAHYILPGLPAACVLAALAVRRVMNQSGCWQAPSVSDGRDGQRLPSLTLGARPLILLLAVIEASIFAGIVLPSQDLTGFRQMVARNEDRLNHAAVLQFGSRNRATAFLVNRPIRWDASRPHWPDGPALILTPVRRLPEVLADGRAKLLDVAGPERSRAERSPAEALALVEVEPIKR